MSAKNNNLRIGLFVLAAVALLVVGLAAFGAKNLFAEKSKCETAVIGDVFGLSVGSRVELRGVPIGKVSRIVFSWNVYPDSKANLVIVEFETEQRFMPLAPGADRKALLESYTQKGLRAVVRSQGVTGTSILALDMYDPVRYPPPPIDFVPQNYYVPSAPGQFTRMLEAVEKSLRSIERIDFDAIGRSVTNALDATTHLAQSIDRIDIEGMATNANALLVEARGAVVHVEGMLGDMRENLKAMKLGTLGQDADGLVVGLRQTNEKLQSVLDNVNAMPLQNAVGDIRNAVQTLNEVLVELKEYPSGFIFGQPPPPAKSVKSPSK